MTMHPLAYLTLSLSLSTAQDINAQVNGRQATAIAITS